MAVPAAWMLVFLQEAHVYVLSQLKAKEGEMSRNFNLKHFEVLSRAKKPVVDRLGPLTACGPCEGDNDRACYAWCHTWSCQHDGCCCDGETDAGSGD